MTVLTAPTAQPSLTTPDAEPINLYQLGLLFVVKCRYWSCRAGNQADELELTPQRIDAKAGSTSPCRTGSSRSAHTR